MPEEACSFRQVDEKHVSVEVDMMCWSPKMDLIAIANVQGEVRHICIYQIHSNNTLSQF